MAAWSVYVEVYTILADITKFASSFLRGDFVLPKSAEEEGLDNFRIVSAMLAVTHQTLVKWSVTAFLEF